MLRVACFMSLMGKSYLIVSSRKEWQEMQVLRLVNDHGFTINAWTVLEETPDIHLMSSKKRLGIDDVRIISQELSKKPFQYPYSITIIDNAQDLTTEAQNALLKILEEPPKSAVIILVAEHSDTLLLTVISRCFLVQDAQSDSRTAESDFAAEQFLESSVGERFLQIKALGKDAVQQKLALEGLLQYLRSNKTTSGGRTSYTKLARLILTMLSYTERQVSGQMALEFLAIKLPVREQ